MAVGGDQPYASVETDSLDNACPFFADGVDLLLDCGAFLLVSVAEVYDRAAVILYKHQLAVIEVKTVIKGKSQRFAGLCAGICRRVAAVSRTGLLVTDRRG